MSINKGSTSLKFRKELSQEAFSETAYYDTNISKYFNKIVSVKYPKKITFNGLLVNNLRYGENPHQSGALYSKDNFDELEKLNYYHLIIFHFLNFHF